MNNAKILEMINNGEIEELKTLLKDEIYQKELSNKPGAKQRYNAMKRYFRYASGYNKALTMPCVLDGYTRFVDGFTAVKTLEGCNDMETYKDGIDGNYFDMDKILKVGCDYDMEKIDVNSILAEAKSRGYKYKKSETGQNQDFSIVFHYRNGFYKVGLLDQAYSIINDGEEAEVYSNDGKTSVLKIVTSIGEMILLPVNFEKVEGNKQVIEVESKYNKTVA